MMQPLSAWTQASWQSAQALIPVPQWLQVWRAAQLQEFLHRGFPQRRDENWKYTSLNGLIEQTFSIPEPSVPSITLDLPSSMISDSDRLVFINGVFSPAHSQCEDLAEKVFLTRCADVMTRDADLYQQANAMASPQALSVFHWLNGALMSDGFFLSVPDNVELKKPIHLLYLTLDTDSVAMMQHPRHIIQLGANSRASVLEEYRGISNHSYFNNVMTKISLGANAQLNYCKLQRETAASVHIGNTLIEQARDSQMRAYHIALGARLNREDLSVSLQDSGADCELSGFYYPKAQQHIDFHTCIDHRYSQSHSRQYYKGIIAAHGRGVFNGKIIAQPQVQKITAKQENHNILLAASAEMDTKPELEVFASDVQCTHGATVGHLDENALFYLRSRGIPEQLARHLLMCGFADEILDHLPDQSIAQYVQSFVRAELTTVDLSGVS